MVHGDSFVQEIRSLRSSRRCFGGLRYRSTRANRTSITGLTRLRARSNMKLRKRWIGDCWYRRHRLVLTCRRHWYRRNHVISREQLLCEEQNNIWSLTLNGGGDSAIRWQWTRRKGRRRNGRLRGWNRTRGWRLARHYYCRCWNEIIRYHQKLSRLIVAYELRREKMTQEGPWAPKHQWKTQKH